jgi:peptidoglycan/LPS O-acetylase OafA/YrhL
MSSNKQHFKQLDGLRGIAIFAVFISHFLPPEVTDWHFFAYGSFGVRLFFVLSGFLITGILLRSKALIESGQSIGYTLKAFYFRRTLRIFCVYYAWLAFIAIFVFRDQRLVWDFLYLSNFYDMFYLEGRGNQYWSLAVEEQFYLVWPFFILLYPLKYLRAALIGLILGVVGIRLYLAIDGAEYLLIKKFPILCMDALGIGGLIALVRTHYRKFFEVRSSIVSWVLFLVGIVLVSIAMVDIWFEQAKGLRYIGSLHTGFMLISAALLIGAVRGYTGILGRVLTLRPLCYLGTISYGCYLFHLAIQSWMVGTSFFQTSHSFAVELLEFWMKVGLTILVATISWYGFEKPINGLKDWFPMDRHRKSLSRDRIISSIRGFVKFGNCSQNICGEDRFSKKK